MHNLNLLHLKEHVHFEWKDFLFRSHSAKEEETYSFGLKLFFFVNQLTMHEGID